MRLLPSIKLSSRLSLSCHDLAVAIFAILRSKTNSFPLSTVIIEQYRPPIDKFIVGPNTLLLTPAKHLTLLARRTPCRYV